MSKCDQRRKDRGIEQGRGRSERELKMERMGMEDMRKKCECLNIATGYGGRYFALGC